MSREKYISLSSPVKCEHCDEEYDVVRVCYEPSSWYVYYIQPCCKLMASTEFANREIKPRTSIWHRFWGLRVRV